MFNIATAQKPAAQALSQDGLSLLLPADLLTTLHLTDAAWIKGWQSLTPSWNALPPDAHLKDGGHYRKRVHGVRSCIHTFPVQKVEARPAKNHHDFHPLPGIKSAFSPDNPCASSYYICSM